MLKLNRNNISLPLKNSLYNANLELANSSGQHFAYPVTKQNPQVMQQIAGFAAARAADQFVLAL